jgi:hypothetical protein
MREADLQSLGIPPAVVLRADSEAPGELPSAETARSSAERLEDGVVLELDSEMPLPPGNRVLRSLASCSGVGWGVIRVEMLNPDRQELVVKVTESPLAEAYGPSVRPVCHLLLGLFEGVAISVFNSEVEGQEVQCGACGDMACRFAISGRQPD